MANKVSQYAKLIAGLGGRPSVDYPRKFGVGSFAFAVSGASSNTDYDMTSNSYIVDDQIKLLYGTSSNPDMKLHIEGLHVSLFSEDAQANAALPGLDDGYIEFSSGEERQRRSLASFTSINAGYAGGSGALATGNASDLKQISVVSPPARWPTPWVVDFATDGLTVHTPSWAWTTTDVLIQVWGFIYPNSIDLPSEDIRPDAMRALTESVGFPGPF